MTATAARPGRNFPDGFRRRSYFVGERERSVWRSWSRSEIRARMLAAQYYDRVNKEPGKRNGPLGHVALEILDALYRIGDAKTGRLDPALDTLQRVLRRSRTAIVQAMKRLYEHGFLLWVRRKVPAETAGGEGPQVRQFSNAYGLRIPERLASFVRHIMRGREVPTPDCEEDRQAEARRDTRRMEDSLPADEFAAHIVDDPETARILASIGRAIEESSASSPGGLNPHLKAES